MPIGACLGTATPYFITFVRAIIDFKIINQWRYLLIFALITQKIDCVGLNRVVLFTGFTEQKNQF